MEKSVVPWGCLFAPVSYAYATLLHIHVLVWTESLLGVGHRVHRGVIIALALKQHTSTSHRSVTSSVLISAFSMLFALSALLLCTVRIVQSCCCKHHLTEVSVGLIFGQSREATSVCILTMFTRVIFWRFVYNSCVVLTFVSIFSSTNSICYCFQTTQFWTVRGEHSQCTQDLERHLCTWDSWSLSDYGCV